MKNNIKIVFTIIVLAFALILMNTVVNAGTITTLDVLEGKTSITVKGTVSTDVNAVAIEIYNKTGTELIKMVTSSVDDNNKYVNRITLPEGTYMVKVADYDGGTFVTKENVVVSSSNIDENEIDEINVTLTVPTIGDKITTTLVGDENLGEYKQDKTPEIKVEGEVNYKVDETLWVSGTYAELGDDFAKPFEGTFEADKYYYAAASIIADEEYTISSTVNVKINGETPADIIPLNNSRVVVVAKIKAKEKVEEETNQVSNEITNETKSEDENKVTNNLPTGDNIVMYMVIFVIAVMGIVVTRKKYSKKHTNKH